MIMSLSWSLSWASLDIRWASKMRPWYDLRVWVEKMWPWASCLKFENATLSLNLAFDLRKCNSEPCLWALKMRFWGWALRSSFENTTMRLSLAFKLRNASLRFNLVFEFLEKLEVSLACGLICSSLAVSLIWRNPSSQTKSTLFKTGRPESFERLVEPHESFKFHRNRENLKKVLWRRYCILEPFLGFVIIPQTRFGQSFQKKM